MIITYLGSTESRLRYSDQNTYNPYFGRTSVCDIWPDITTNIFVVVALFYEYLSNKMLNNGFWSALIIGEALKTFLGTNGYIRI